MREHHCGGLVAHHGRDKTIQAMKERYFGPHKERVIVEFVKWCPICQTEKGTTHNTALYNHLIANTNQHLGKYKHGFHFGTY